MSKKCETIDCKTNSRLYNYEGETEGKYCAKCGKKQGMVHIKKGKDPIKCKNIGCNNIMSEDSQRFIHGGVCEKCSQKSTSSGKCKFQNCENDATFMNEHIGEFEYCYRHKLHRMVDVKPIICEVEDCRDACKYNDDTKLLMTTCKRHSNTHHNSSINCSISSCSTKSMYDNAMYCYYHGFDELIPTVVKYCIEHNCWNEPTHNYKYVEPAIYCSKHKKKTMTKCKGKLAYPPQGKWTFKFATYNADGREYVGSKQVIDYASLYKSYSNEDDKNTILTFAQFHKINRPYFVSNATSLKASREMLWKLVTEKKCIWNRCDEIPTHNFPNYCYGILCAKHKLSGMISSSDSTCQQSGCLQPAKFGKLHEDATHCELHKKKNQYSDNERYPKCNEVGCGDIAKYAKNENSYPTKCAKHCRQDKNVVEKPCKVCGLEYKKEEMKNGTCEYCRKKTIRGAKESAMKDLLKEHKIGIATYNKKIKNGSYDYRPDFFINKATFNIILEVDENQHKSYDKDCEIKRMYEIHSEALGEIPTIFIRYNCDEYVDIDNVKHEKGDPLRVINLIKQLRKLPAIVRGLFIIYVYYDGDDGTNKIYSFDDKKYVSLEDIKL